MLVVGVAEERVRSQSALLATMERWQRYLLAVGALILLTLLVLVLVVEMIVVLVLVRRQGWRRRRLLLVTVAVVMAMDWHVTGAGNVILVLEGAHLGGRVLSCCGRRGHIEKRIVVRMVMMMVGQRRFRWVIVLVVGFLNAIVNSYSAPWTVAILAAAPISDVFVVVAAHFIVSIAVKYKCSSAPLSGHKSDA